ncbi:MAG TPA: succinate dehydrogenase assembly factor 2 [Caldimonas sp.]|nr:succinate dehydrogenase assembly factor 2 [Caldimonas sp.]
MAPSSEIGRLVDAGESSGVPIDERALSRLRWRCRRGMLENDLLIERFFARRGVVDEADRIGMTSLMALGDNDLLDLFLGRQEPIAELDTPEVRQVLAAVRPTRPSHASLPSTANPSRTLP